MLPGEGEGTLLLVEPFPGLAAATLAGVLDELVRLAARVQVVYLTDQAPVLSWAADLHPSVGALRRATVALHSVPSPPAQPTLAVG